METYKLFTKEPIKSLEEIILREAIPLAREKLAKGLDNNQFTTTKQCILNNAPILIFRGLGLLRKRNEEGKKIYELFHGCILSAFLNSIESKFRHDLFYPEDESYDFLIMKYPRGKTADFKPTENKEICKNGVVFRMELAELTRLEDLERIITDKSRYTKRIPLFSIAFNGKLNFQEVFNKAKGVNKNSFETIWLMGQVNNPENKNKLAYFIAELVKHSEVFPLFELNLDWNSINKKISEAFNH